MTKMIAAYGLVILCTAQFFVLPRVSAYTYERCSPTWSMRGCKTDFHRNLSILIDDRKHDNRVKIDFDNFNGYVRDLACRCRSTSSSLGFTWFALMNLGLCVSRVGSLNTYLQTHPLDPPDRCTGDVKYPTHLISKDNGQRCIGGQYRAFFYEIQEDTGSAPAGGSSPSSGSEEEVSGSSSSGSKQYIGASPSSGSEEEVSGSSSSGSEQNIGASPSSGSEEEVSGSSSSGSEQNIGAAPASGSEEEVSGSSSIPGQKRCTKASDVILVVDVSGSVGADNFKLVLEFLRKFVDRYDFSGGNSRLGIVTFDENCYVDLTWTQSSSLTVPGIKQVIDNLKYTGGSTLTDNALKCARDNIINPSQRAGVPKTIIVMTDGMSWNGLNRLPAPSQQLRGMGCKMLAIGISNQVDPNELQIITGDPDLVFLRSSFQKLIEDAENTLNDIIEKACVV